VARPRCGIKGSFIVLAETGSNPSGSTSKGNNKRGNKEIKKPKQEKAKVSATANSGAGKPEISIAGKKVK
jgi:hypothetical protein